MFGGTLALKGAIEERRTLHCEPGCMFCELEGVQAFHTWAEDAMQQQQSSAVHEHVHFNPTPRVP